GLSPALHLIRSGGEVLRGTGRNGGGSRGGRFGSTLVVVQTTLAMVLLVGGGLLMKSIAGMRNQDFGFDPEGVLTLRVSPPASDYAELEDRLALWNAIEDKVRALPSVSAAGTTQSHPLMGSNWANTIRLAATPDRERTVRVTYATPGYFDVLGIRPIQGRLLTKDDGRGSPMVAVVNEAFVRAYVGEGIDPLSQSILREEAGPEAVPIVGVIPDMVERAVDRAAEPNWYLHPDQGGIWARSILARVNGSPGEALPAIQQAVWSEDASLPLYQVETMEAIVSRRLGGFVLIANLMGGFALLSLTLGAVGIYGVTAFAAGQRRQEIGLRKALGAEESQVVSMVVRSGAWRAAAGLFLGFIAAAGVARLLGSILVGVSPWDPWVFFTVAAMLGAVSLVGLWIPARRAATVDAARALSAD
ncbi:MAG: ABC transporter permease, partial [Gemmatimonadota bacterium]|nr:ABC transporter permease [Gemmatimonadota bacterium]